MKKLFIAIIILVPIGISFLPVIATKMADAAFDKPEDKHSPEALKRALQIDTSMFLHSIARPIAEKAIIYFPESKDMDYFVYTAAICSTRDGKPEAAQYWYQRFVDIYPKHPWTQQARNNLNKLKELNR